MNKRTYGLFTAITMITGIVIGSGIFFKSDDVLGFTGGNVSLGIIVFLVAAIAIIFGSLTISMLAMKTDKPGGLVAYTEEFVGMGTSTAFGWFQTFLYLPTLAAVVSWVCGIYIAQLFGWGVSLENSTMIGFIVLTGLFIYNTISAKWGGYLQNTAMVIKLVPLFLIAIFGIIFGNPSTVMSADIKSFTTSVSDWGWISAFAPIAFSFDGWIISTSICHEIKNSKRNLPLALTISPLIILLAYVLYFVGVTSLLGPDTVLELGDGSAYKAANMIFGNIGAKVILTFVVISVIGTVNGIALGFIRIPYSLALRNMVPGSKVLSKESKQLNGMPLNSAIFAYGLSVFWLIVHYLTQKFGMSGDVSEIAIGVSYLNYIVLYVAVMKLAKKGEIKGVFKGYIIPVLATLGSLVILSGSVKNTLFIYYVAICFAIMIAGALFYRKNKKNII